MVTPCWFSPDLGPQEIEQALQTCFQDCFVYDPRVFSHQHMSRYGPGCAWFFGIDIDSYLLERTPGSCHALVGVWDRFQVPSGRVIRCESGAFSCFFLMKQEKQAPRGHISTGSDTDMG